MYADIIGFCAENLLDPPNGYSAQQAISVINLIILFSWTTECRQDTNFVIIAQWSVGWKYLSTPKLERLQCWNLEMDE